MEKLLFITDLSEAGEKALGTALELGRKFTSDIVIWPIVSSTPMEEAHFRYRELIAAARKEKQIPIQVIPFAQRSQWKDAFDSLIKQFNVNLILLGAGNDRGEISRFILDHSTLPLWIFGEEAAHNPGKNMVFASDFRYEHLAILSELMFLARSLNAHIQCVHFVTENEPWSEKQVRLHEQLYHLDKASPLVSFDMEDTEDVKVSLLQYPQTHPMDILVLGTHDFEQSSESLTRELLPQIRSSVLIYHVNGEGSTIEAAPEIPTQVNYMLI